MIFAILVVFFLKTMDIERYRPLFFAGLPLIGGQVNVAIS